MNLSPQQRFSSLRKKLCRLVEWKGEVVRAHQSLNTRRLLGFVTLQSDSRSADERRQYKRMLAKTQALLWGFGAKREKGGNE